MKFEVALECLTVVKEISKIFDFLGKCFNIY